MILLKTTDNEKNAIQKVIVIIFTIALDLVVCFIVVTIQFVNIMFYSNGKILYRNKQNDKHYIQIRYEGGGAWDQEEAKEFNYEVKELTSFLIWAKEIDIDSIDKSKWVKINQKKGD
ncbi:MAG: hypothetical protein Kapaf2KO_15810 [Candidatus Kapaibacteriales bacterium]